MSNKQTLKLLHRVVQKAGVDAVSLLVLPSREVVASFLLEDAREAPASHQEGPAR